MLGALLSLDAPGLAARASRLQRAAETERPAPYWRCDPVPLPLTATEFATLERGLRQRARLLEAILADLYGEQTTLARGVLPPALAFANAHFLRACRGAPRQGPFLHAYAADLVRSQDGQWRVLADRTRGGFGIGYASESRRLLARVMPELFRSNQVRPLRPFFEAWQDALLRTADVPGERPAMIAMLTQGVTDAHWPEHSALARDLGCALVEARDLTVRDDRLYLKTLRGLQPIDVLLRRVPGDQLDPLEVAGAGLCGVVGLLEAERRGGVQILNHPGAALVEAPAMAVFMPSLCRTLLGEPLQLATLPSMWLADEGAKRTVATGFRRWAIRPAFDGTVAPVPLAGLGREERIALEDDIAASPWKYVGCTIVPPSLAPCHTADGLVPQPVVLRLFLMHDGQSWQIMPGGLARVLPPGAHAGEALPPDGQFKDVWVQREENEEIRGVAAAGRARVRPLRHGGDMPSRVAEDFFVLGRTVERLESVARLCRAGLVRQARGALLPRELAELDLLGTCLRRIEALEACNAANFHLSIRDLLQPGGALAAGLERVALLTSSLQDRLTAEAHAAFLQAIRSARAELRDGLASGVDGMAHAMTAIQLLATTVAGVAAEGMAHGGGRLFLEMGRRLERATLTAGSLAVVLGQPPSRVESALRLALELCDSALSYHSRYLAAMQPAPVVDLVLADPGNPRALGYQLAHAADLLEIAGDPQLAWTTQELSDRAVSLASRVEAAHDPALIVSRLPEDLHALADGTAALFDRIARRFFTLLPPTRSVGLELA